MDDQDIVAGAAIGIDGIAGGGDAVIARAAAQDGQPSRNPAAGIGPSGFQMRFWLERSTQ